MKDTKKNKKVEPVAIFVPLEKLASAPWNTHSRSERGDAAFEGLIQSVREVGVLQPITVRTDANGEYEIVDGHRRVEAAMALGIPKLRCDVYEGLSDADARVLTATANLQRLDNDPLLEAELIEKMRKDGRTLCEIGATLGKTESYVTRRARLTNLSGTWREVFRRTTEGASVALMEFVAAHEQPLQDAVAKEMQLGGWELKDGGDEDVEDDWTWGGDDEYELSADEVRRVFDNEKMEITDAVPFDRRPCAKCAANTATHGCLFPAEEDEDVKGRCQNAKCYCRKWNEAVDAKIAALRGRGLKPLEKENRWSIPDYWNLSDHEDKAHPQPWVYADAGGLRRVEWGEKPEAKSEKAAKPAMTKAEKEALRERRRLHGEWEAARRTAFAKMRQSFVPFNPGAKGTEAEAKVRKAVEAVADGERFREAAVSHVVGKMRDYSRDGDCWEVWHWIGADGFRSLGVELTDAEAEAMDAEDPING